MKRLGGSLDGANHAEVFFPRPQERCLRGRRGGIDLATPEQAREEAIAAAREIVAERICAGRPQTETYSRS
ncbi:DUF6894 family protein [Rhizobium laguerreae]|uniref:DUF6894 family protein n=1 Tax=Rhizobium TaxID=379 RepID=UPI0035E4212D